MIGQPARVLPEHRSREPQERRGQSRQGDSVEGALPGDVRSLTVISEGHDGQVTLYGHASHDRVAIACRWVPDDDFFLDVYRTPGETPDRTEPPWLRVTSAVHCRVR